MNEIARLIRDLKNKGVSLKVLGDDLEVSLYKENISDEVFDPIRENKQAIKEYIKSLRIDFNHVEIPIVSEKECYPVSDAQRRLWILSQFEEDSITFNIPGHLVLDQQIDISNIQKAVLTTIERHEILRTVFKVNESGELKQWVLNSEDFNFEINNLNFSGYEDILSKVDEYIAEDTNKPFNLENGPLLRVSLIQVEANKLIFYYNIHHIISDGWSLEVLTKDVLAYYEAFSCNNEPTIKPLRIQYKDYSMWQLNQLNSAKYKTHQAYWLHQLKGELTVLNLPSNKRRPKVKTNKGQSLETHIDKLATAKLKQYSKVNGGSLFIGLLAICKVLLYKYTAQKDIIVGTPMAGREHPDLQDQIGFYVNTLVLRNEIKAEECFDVFYERIKENTLQSFAHQMYPFDRLFDELDIRLDKSRIAIFDIMLTLQNKTEKSNELDEKSVDFIHSQLNEVVELGKSVAKFDIDFTFQEVGDYLSFRILYNSDVYESEMVKGLMQHFKQLLNQLLENPKEKIAQINYLSTEEKNKLLVTFNGCKVDYPKNKTVIALFEEQAIKSPKNTALIVDEMELSYQELNEQANKLAHYLREKHDIQPDDLVGVSLDRSEWMIISILGILKSGGAYVPIDSEYPQERINYMVADSKCKLIIDKAEIQKFRDKQDNYDKTNLAVISHSENLAYVIYTSGTTGKPKGVMITQKSIQDYALTFKTIFNVSEKDKVIQQASISFDTHVEEIFPTLLAGATLLLCKSGGKDLQELTQLIQQKKATILSATPWLLKVLNDLKSDLSEIRLLISGGDKLDTSFVSNYLGKLPIYDTYGPSETTVCATYSEITEDREIAVIGRPINNRTVYILGDQNELLMLGVIGEICIGGSGLALGYLNQPELTKEKFIQNPFKDGEKIYKSGDLGRWLPNGDIEFIGRKDDQVKIRGYRIELGEVEHVLRRYEKIDEAIVLLQEDKEKAKKIVAYFTVKKVRNSLPRFAAEIESLSGEDNSESLNTSSLMGYLNEILPAYMIPSDFVQVKTIPLSVNGKVDKQALSNLEKAELPTGEEFVAPRNAIEEKLVEIWEEVLGKNNIGIKNNFFTLGGHSLSAIRVISKIQKEYNTKLEVATLFEENTIEKIADFLGLILIDSSALEEEMDEFKI